MAINISTIARTVRILKPYAVTQKMGRNGAFNSESVMFSIATDREYKSTVQNDDGTVSQERKTDFYACRATGPIARLFNQYCSATKTDENGNAKLVSRRLYIKGHLETYDNVRNEQIAFNYNGQNLTVNAPIKESNKIIIVVDSIEFLDADPVKKMNAQAAAMPYAQAPQAYTAPQAYAQPTAQVYAQAPQAQVYTAPEMPAVPMQATAPQAQAYVAPAQTAEMPTVPMAQPAGSMIAPF